MWYESTWVANGYPEWWTVMVIVKMKFALHITNAETIKRVRENKIEKSSEWGEMLEDEGVNWKINPSSRFSYKLMFEFQNANMTSWVDSTFGENPQVLTQLLYNVNGKEKVRILKVGDDSSLFFWEKKIIFEVESLRKKSFLFWRKQQIL